MRLLLHRSGTVHRRFSVISSSEARRQLWSQCSVLAPFCQPRVISLVHQTGESTRFLTPKNILDIDETVTSASSSWYQHLQPCQYQVADARLVAFVAFHFVLLGIFLFLFFIFAIPIILNTSNVICFSLRLNKERAGGFFLESSRNICNCYL